MFRDLEGPVSDFCLALGRPHRGHRGWIAGRSRSLNPRNAILLTMIWLQNYPTHQVLGLLFGISIRCVSSTIIHVLTLMHMSYVPRYIRWHAPRHWQRLRGTLPQMRDVVGMLDCTSIRINTPSGPLQRWYYRRDKPYHFMNWLVVVDANGCFTFGKAGFRGHLIDAAVFDYANMPALPPGLRLLADKGFAHLNPLLLPLRPGERGLNEIRRRRYNQ